MVGRIRVHAQQRLWRDQVPVDHGFGGGAAGLEARDGGVPAHGFFDDGGEVGEVQGVCVEESDAGGGGEGGADLVCEFGEGGGIFEQEPNGARKGGCAGSQGVRSVVWVFRKGLFFVVRLCSDPNLAMKDSDWRSRLGNLRSLTASDYEDIASIVELGLAHTLVVPRLQHIRHEILTIGILAQSVVNLIDHKRTVLRPALHNSRYIIHHPLDEHTGQWKRGPRLQKTSGSHESEDVVHKKVIFPIFERVEWFPKDHVARNVESDPVEKRYHVNNAFCGGV